MEVDGTLQVTWNKSLHLCRTCYHHLHYHPLGFILPFDSNYYDLFFHLLTYLVSLALQKQGFWPCLLTSPEQKPVWSFLHVISLLAFMYAQDLFPSVEEVTLAHGNQSCKNLRSGTASLSLEVSPPFFHSWLSLHLIAQKCCVLFLPQFLSFTLGNTFFLSALTLGGHCLERKPEHCSSIYLVALQ